MQTKSLISFAFGPLSLLIILPCANGGEGIPGDPWRFSVEDISAETPTPGATTYDPGTEIYTVTADGWDIWGNADEFRFLYIEASGDVSVSVCVLENPFQGGTNILARGGVMVRQKNTAGSVHISRTVSREGGCDTQGRDHEGQLSCGGASWPYGVSYPFWVRLRREGDTWYSDYSTDGANWQHQPGSQQVLPMSDPVLVGLCLTSREPKVLTTVRFTDFRLNGLGPQTRAEPGKGQWVYGGETVTLDGSGSALANTYHWEQLVVSDEPRVTLDNGNPPNGISSFMAPSPLTIGIVLTFRLMITGQTGADIAETHVNVRATNPPKFAPSDLRALPLDVHTGGLGFRLEWDSVFDAEKYQVGLKLGTNYFWLCDTTDTRFDFTGMVEGQEVIVAVRGENRFSDPSKHGAISQDLSYIAMPNLAAPASLGGSRPPSQYVYVPSMGPPISALNDGLLDTYTFSFPAPPKEEDYWGYLWNQAYFFDHIVYYTGPVEPGDGWFASLRVQYTEDGVDWKDVPIENIIPPLDFTGNYFARRPFTRYDISIPTVKGSGIRIYGTPGGMNRYTTIAELEVFGDQTRVGDVIQAVGLDAEFEEGSTATLDGSHSYSTAGPIVLYEWQQVSGPAVTIQYGGSGIATFVAPIVDKDEVLVFSLRVSDGTDEDVDDDVRITVRNVEVPETKADAGPDQIVFEGDPVTLDGSASTSSSGSLTYLWTQLLGVSVGVTGRTTPTVVFTAPTIWAYEEPLTFRLDVDDGAGGISSDLVVVTVMNTVAWPAYALDEAEGTFYLKNLLHLGQNATDRILSPLDINGDPLSAFGGQARQKPYPGLEYDFTGTGVTVTQNPMRWTPIFDETGFFGDEPIEEFQQVYHVYILSPEARQARFHFRHDDEIRGWNNGILVINRDGWDAMSDQVEDFSLEKGLNSITLKFREFAGPNHLAVGITTLTDESWGDLLYSLGPSLILTDVYASRSLPDSFGKGETVNVSLSVRVNPANVPASVTVVENIPAGVPESNVSAPGAVIGGGTITWNLTGPLVKHQTLSYSVTVPTKVSDALRFSGTLTFGATTVDIF